MRITDVESIVVHCQDTSEGMSEKENVGGYTGYQILLRISTDEGVEGWASAILGEIWEKALPHARC